MNQIIAERRLADGEPHNSGFLLLSGPQAAYGSRLALVDAAQHTIDIQSYAIHADASAERLLLGVVAAARRGVRVRILLDDFHSTGRDAQVMRLAFVPNIEMRMFNPLTGARGSPIGRAVSMLTDFTRVQQRMHNKLFIADNAMAIAGGRNIGDAYFGHAESGNFVDLDVLAAGPIVQDLSRSFDSYWNNDRAYPVQSLVSKQELDVMRELFAQKRDGAARPDSPNTSPRGAPTDGIPSARNLASNRPPDASANANQRRTRVWNHQPMDLTQARFTWAAAAVLVDKPAKIAADADAAAPAAGSSGATIADVDSSRPSGTAATDNLPDRGQAPNSESGRQPVAAPSAREHSGETVVDGLLQLMSEAKRELLIVSPYFVPGPDMKQAFASARARGVRVRVLTNSLASNDAPIAHAGYARHRPDLLAMGVELFEMRSELPAALLGSMGSTGSMGGRAEKAAGGANGAPGASRAMLHSKLLVRDGRLLAVGSMNLDMRSQLQNTEIALLIRSRHLSAQATAQIETAMRTAAWRVELADDGKSLVWKAPEGSDREDETTEPDASVPLRLLLQLLGPLAPDHLL